MNSLRKVLELFLLPKGTSAKQNTYSGIKKKNKQSFHSKTEKRKLLKLMKKLKKI